MVGVPTSKGCTLCLARSIKCDEARPSCLQCRRGRRACPGYSREMKFVDEGPKLRRRVRETAPRAPGGTSARYSGDTSAAPIHITAVARTGGPGLEHRSGAAVDTRAQRGFQLAGLNVSREYCHQTISAFISDIFPVGTPSAQSSFLGTWLWHVPLYLGRHPFLDAATLSLALAYFARLSRDQMVLRRAELSYGAALKSLATLVTDPRKGLGAEVLCAVLLLGHFETFVDRGHAWIRHAGGAAHLMRLRGARKCYDSAFEYSMFLSCRGAIIAEALTSREPCFLDAGEWQSVPDGLIEFPLLPSYPDLYHEIFGYFAAIPGLLKEAKSIGSDTADSTRHSVLSRATMLRDKIRQWHHRYISDTRGPTVQVLVNPPPCLDTYPFHSVYVYRDVTSATMITASHAYMIALNKDCIDSIQSHSDCAEANMEMALAICMSVDYCSRSGYCGASTMKFALPIIQPVLPLKHHVWIEAWLSKFSGVVEAARVR